MWVLGLVICVDQADQSVLRGVQTLIKADFHLSDASVGLLASAFVLVHAVATIPAGYFADRWNRKRAISRTIVAWSGFSALTALSPNFGAMLGVRALLGFGQAITEPSAGSLINDYYPSDQRGRAFSNQQLMGFVGVGLGLAVGGAVGAAAGWRLAFIVVALPGVITAVLAARLREPRRGHADAISAGLEVSADEDDTSQPRMFEHGLGVFVTDMLRGLRQDVATIVAIPTMRYVMVGIGALLFSATGIGYWLPVYHERFSGLSLTRATSAVGAVLLIGGVSGTVIGGRVADRFQTRVRGARIAIPAYSIMAATVIFVISFLPMPAAPDLLLQTIGMFVATMAIPSLRAGMGDAVPAQLRGAGFAAFSLISAVSGAAAAPPVLGLLSDLTNLRIAFLICMPPIFLGALILLRARDHLEQDAAKVLMAVQRAYQEQEALERERAAAEQSQD